MTTAAHTLWYPKAPEGQRPSPWWFYGRALFVSRHDYWKIFLKFLAVGIPLGLVGLIGHSVIAWYLAFFTGFLGLALLILSLIGLYLQYGHPAPRYFKKLLTLGGVSGPVTMADIHIGTYRHSYIFSELLPGSTVYSVDCKHEPRFSEELAVREVQALETPPAAKNITTLFTKDFCIHLADNSCDVVVFGFGTHEIPGPQRTMIFTEAKRILKPGGKLLMFEHGIDPLNYVIFGPVIYHVTRAREWCALLTSLFSDLKQSRLFAVNLFSATNKK